ncbi:MAG TPA: hypothetical protein PLM75_10045 [bacterium]|nr:hypothetical protein [bacterium]
MMEVKKIPQRHFAIKKNLPQRKDFKDSLKLRKEEKKTPKAFNKIAAGVNLR